MHPFAMETAAILVHGLNRFSLCTKMATMTVAKLLLCYDTSHANALFSGKITNPFSQIVVLPIASIRALIKK